MRPLGIRGSVTPSGDGIDLLDPILRYPWKISPTPADASGPYELEAADADRTAVVVRRFDARQRAESPGDGAGFTDGFFSLVVPFPVDKDAETVSIRRGGAVLWAMTRSSFRPEIGSIALSPALISTQPITVQWSVADADTPAGELFQQVVYSFDGGESFEPVAVDLEASVATFDPGRFLPGLPGQSLLRIIVSDGLNSVFKDVPLPAADLGWLKRGSRDELRRQREESPPALGGSDGAQPVSSIRG